MGYRARIANTVLAESWWFDPVPWALDLVRGAGVITPGHHPCERNRFSVRKHGAD